MQREEVKGKNLMFGKLLNSDDKGIVRVELYKEGK